MSGRSFHVRCASSGGGRISLDTRRATSGSRTDQLHHASEPCQADRGHLPPLRTPRCCSTDGAQDAIDEVLVRPAASCSPTGRARNRAHTRLASSSNVLGCWRSHRGYQRRRTRSKHLLPARLRQGAERVLSLQRRGGGRLRRAPFADGLDAIYYVAQKTIRPSSMEMVFPLRLRRYALHQDSGGPGASGAGRVIRELELTARRGISMAIPPDKSVSPAGVNGGPCRPAGLLHREPGRADERRPPDVRRQRPAPGRRAPAGPTGAAAGPSLGSAARAVRRDSWPASSPPTRPARTTAWSSTRRDVDLPHRALRARPRGRADVHRNSYFGPLVESRAVPYNPATSQDRDVSELRRSLMTTALFR